MPVLTGIGQLATCRSGGGQADVGLAQPWLERADLAHEVCAAGLDVKDQQCAVSAGQFAQSCQEISSRRDTAG